MANFHISVSVTPLITAKVSTRLKYTILNKSTFHCKWKPTEQVAWHFGLTWSNGGDQFVKEHSLLNAIQIRSYYAPRATPLKTIWVCTTKTRKITYKRRVVQPVVSIVEIHNDDFTIIMGRIDKTLPEYKTVLLKHLEKKHNNPSPKIRCSRGPSCSYKQLKPEMSEDH